jgi:hypothetical protein
MLPIIFEWSWDLGHYIFFGLFYLALTIISGGLIYVCIKSLIASSGNSHH